MGLRAKLFITFLAIILGLLGFTTYYSHTRTLTFETDRTLKELRNTEARFRDRFEEERAFTEKLVSTITSDQKYRSFLQQIRDNFFIFAQEIKNDTGVSFVFITDEEMTIRGVSTPPGDYNLDKLVAAAQAIVDTEHVSALIEQVLETGQPISRIIAYDRKLINSVNVPLKESLTDDYALGVVSAGIEISDDWVKAHLGGAADGAEVIFYVEDQVVATNVDPEKARAILAAIEPPDRPSQDSYIQHGQYHVAVHDHFDGSGIQAGYIFAASLDAAMLPFIDLQWKIIWIGLVALALGLLIVVLLTNRIIFPVRALVRGTGEVISGNYEFEVDNDSADEIGQLGRAFNQMVIGLKEKEQIRNLFGKYVHPTIVADIMDNPEHLKLGGERRTKTLLFSDIAGFTSISEGMDPQQLVSFLNEYLGAMSNEIASADGILDKYLGDGIMAFWGPPFVTEQFELKACRAAICMQDRLSELRQDWSERGLPVIDMRVGLATGDVIVGNIGSEQSQDYTCIG
ncbi:MAG TPA: adenylate/guanylate cyclase domain-containing protein, partial [Rhodospirillales bacterium]|nr:adenylate/guanylate cyclase domain-containing protein [Rhodospirillales bacterium]